MEHEVKKEAGELHVPAASKFKHATPIECLKWQLKKKTIDGDAEDDEIMITDK